MKKLNSQLSLCYAVFNGIFAVCLGVEYMLLIYASLDESYCLPRSNLGSCEIKLYHFKDLLEESLNSFQCESLPARPGLNQQKQLNFAFALVGVRMT